MSLARYIPNFSLSVVRLVSTLVTEEIKVSNDDKIYFRCTSESLESDGWEVEFTNNRQKIVITRGQNYVIGSVHSVL